MIIIENQQDIVEALKKLSDQLEVQNKRLDAQHESLVEHMAGTRANQERIKFMEEFAQKALETQQENFKDMLKSNKDHQEAQNRQLKIVIGIVAALATLVTATAVWINNSNNTVVTQPQTQTEVTK